jgi:hypothetical protein
MEIRLSLILMEVASTLSLKNTTYFCGLCLQVCPLFLSQVLTSLLGITRMYVSSTESLFALSFLFCTPVFCIQGDAQDITLLRLRPFHAMLDSLGLRDMFPRVDVLQTKSKLDVLFTSECFVADAEAATTAHSSVGAAAVHPFSVKSMRSPLVIGTTPVRANNALFPKKLDVQQSLATELARSSSSSDSLLSASMLASPLSKSTTNPGLGSASKKSPFSPNTTSPLPLFQRSPSVFLSPSPAKSSFSSSRHSLSSGVSFASSVKLNSATSAASILAGEGRGVSVPLKPSKSLCYAGFQRLLCRLAADLHPDWSADKALHWLIHFMRSKMAPNLDKDRVRLCSYVFFLSLVNCAFHMYFVLYFLKNIFCFLLNESAG